MSRLLSVICLLIAAVFPRFVQGGESPDGTTFRHSVLSVDGADLVRIRYCGLPLQARLANVQFKGAESEKLSLQYLKETLRAGSNVKIELEPDLPGDGTAPPLVQMFAGNTHLNLELVKRGLAVSDARSQKFGAALQAGQTEAMTKKLGVWALAAPAPAETASLFRPPTPPRPASVAEKENLPEIAPAGYGGPVVADLSSKEYHFPSSRYARNIRAGARIEYKTPDEAERAGKIASPFSFPDRAQAQAEKAANTVGSGSSEKVIGEARKALTEAVTFMQEARKASRANSALANENWKKAAKLLTQHLDRLTPVADANPHDQTLQKLTEEMSMNLYSCNKYQSL